MASSGLRFLGLFCLVLLVQKSSARQFIVGGSEGWTVPQNNTTNSYNQWAENNRFQIGDSLMFVYNSGQDSVLLVSKEDYDNCNTASAISTFKDGHTVYPFNQSGPHYFISGNKENCQKNEKLVVVVLADRSVTTTASPPTPTPTTPTPSPTPTSPPPAPSVPAPSPTPTSSPPAPSLLAPSPTPASSPPSATASPTPAPKSHKNAASPTLISPTGYIGALFFASSLVLVY